jgi:hypothetical protein
MGIPSPADKELRPAKAGRSCPCRFCSCSCSVRSHGNCPPDSGWDADGHIEHIRYVAERWGVPLAEQGWETYQPPAYYFVAAGIYRSFLPQSIRTSGAPRSPSDDFLALKAVQLMTPIFALLQILIVLKTLALFHRNKSPSLLLPPQLF